MVPETDHDEVPGGTGAEELELPKSEALMGEEQSSLDEGSGEQQLRIELYDAMGRRVATLYEGVAAAGEHVLPFDAAGFVPGMYFVRLVTGGKTEVRKMVVVGGGR